LYQQTSNDAFHGFAALSPKTDLVPFSYIPRPLGAHDVEVRITHSGIW
jgi:alcohol dehydrogenase (NADP+)